MNLELACKIESVPSPVQLGRAVQASHALVQRFSTRGLQPHGGPRQVSGGSLKITQETGSALDALGPRAESSSLTPQCGAEA